MRDIEKAIKSGEAILAEHNRLELNVSEAIAICQRSMFRDNETGAESRDTALLIDASYKVGLAVGYRTALRDMKAKK